MSKSCKYFHRKLRDMCGSKTDICGSKTDICDSKTDICDSKTDICDSKRSNKKLRYDCSQSVRYISV